MTCDGCKHWDDLHAVRMTVHDALAIAQAAENELNAGKAVDSHLLILQQKLRIANDALKLMEGI